MTTRRRGRALWQRHPSPRQVRARITLIVVWGGMMLAVLIADGMGCTNHG